MISAACYFLDELEKINNSDEELPVPYVMERIYDILRRKSILSKQKPTTTTAVASYATPPLDDQEYAVSNFTKALRTIEGMNGTIYIDTQFLNSNQGYLIKEISLRCHGSPAASILVKPPTGALSSYDNRYSIERIHGISWDSGDIDITVLRSLLKNLFNSGRSFVLKGQKKVEMLERLGLSKQRMESMDDFPNLQTLRQKYPSPGCHYHRGLEEGFACAQKHTYALMCHHTDGDVWPTY